jgi:hypothetical protein
MFFIGPIFAEASNREIENALSLPFREGQTVERQKQGMFTQEPHCLVITLPDLVSVLSPLSKNSMALTVDR